MSRDKLIISGVVVLGLLGGLVYRQAKKDESLGQPVASAAELPTVSAPDDVDKISITNGDKGEVVLQKVPDPTGTASDGGRADEVGPHEAGRGRREPADRDGPSREPEGR